MSSGCGDVLSLADLQTAKKHQLFEAEVITGKQGGISTGTDIDYATNQVTGQSQKTLPAVLRDAGFQPASFDFATGGTLGANDRDKVVYDPVSKTWYSWGGALPHVIAAGANPVGVADWTPQTDPTLREDLASSATNKGGYLVGVKKTGTNTTATTVSAKLNTFINFATDYCGGAITGQPDLTTQLQDAIIDAFNSGIPKIHIIGDFYTSDTVLLYPGVTLVGGGYDKTIIRCTAGMAAGATMIRSHRPAGWAAGCNNIGIEDVYLVGRAAKDVTAVDFGDSSYFHLHRLRTDLFDNAICFNKWIDEGRTGTSPNFSYPRAASPAIGGQCYFGKIEQCAAIDCTRAVVMAGVFNRNTEISCTWSSCDLAYKFDNPRGVYETNTFISTNIEGCKSVWSWFYSINSPYANTWITTSIDNGNAFTCQAGDGGRQTFINLSLFPYNDPTRVNWFLANPNGHRSTVLGTDIGESLGDYQLKTQFREEIHGLVGFYNKVFGSGTLSSTIAANGGTYNTSVAVPGLTSGAAVCWTLGQLYPGLVVQVASVLAGAVHVQVVNISSNPVTINTSIQVTGISKSFL